MNYVFRKFTKLSHYNYDQQGKDWNVNAGKHQSPVSLANEKAVKSNAPGLSFINYNKKFSSPINLTNNGHTLKMAIPCTYDGTQPAVCGCQLKCVYKAVQLHFHWGSPKRKGSEHAINCSQFDAELHILHQNSAYALKKDALCFPDGFVVLAVMVNIVQCPKIKTRVLNEVCNKAILVRDYNKTSTIKEQFALTDILTGMESTEFFTYRGSLTTPPCAEAVNWFVFPKPIEVSKKYFQNLWLLTDERGLPLTNNYRAIQSLNNRKVYYKNENSC